MCLSTSSLLSLPLIITELLESSIDHKHRMIDWHTCEELTKDQEREGKKKCQCLICFSICEISIVFNEEMTRHESHSFIAGQRFSSKRPKKQLWLVFLSASLNEQWGASESLSNDSPEQWIRLIDAVHRRASGSSSSLSNGDGQWESSNWSLRRGEQFRRSFSLIPLRITMKWVWRMTLIWCIRSSLFPVTPMKDAMDGSRAKKRVNLLLTLEVMIERDPREWGSIFFRSRWKIHRK